MDSLQAVAEHRAPARLTDLIRQLLPIDRQVILSYLEGMDAAADFRKRGGGTFACDNSQPDSQRECGQL